MPGLIHFKTRSKISKVLVKYSNNCWECCLFDIIHLIYKTWSFNTCQCLYWQSVSIGLSKRVGQSRQHSINQLKRLAYTRGKKQGGGWWWWKGIRKSCPLLTQGWGWRGLCLYTYVCVCAYTYHPKKIFHHFWQVLKRFRFFAIIKLSYKK